MLLLSVLLLSTTVEVDWITAAVLLSNEGVNDNELHDVQVVALSVIVVDMAI